MLLKRKLRDIWTCLANRHSVVAISLYTFGLGGVVGVLVDLDHWLNETGVEGWGLAGRPFHVPLAVIAGCFGIYCCTRLGRLANKLVLKLALLIIVLVVSEIAWAMYMSNV